MSGNFVRLAGWVLLISVAQGCSRSMPAPGERYPQYPREPVSQGRIQAQREWPVEVERRITSTRRKRPWEIWSYHVNLSGQPLKDQSLLAGDRALEDNQVQLALKYYNEARSAQLSAEDREALVLRLASTELLLDRPKNALSIISDHFNRLNQSVESVNPYFSLIVAYGYGRSGDIEQSLAWFSRINQIAAGKGAISSGAAQGVRLLIRALSDEDLQRVSRYWSSDALVSSIIGQEQRLRASRGYTQSSTANDSAFWEGDYAERNSVATSSLDGHYRLVALLPLSGPYGSLGQSIKNGVEIALTVAAGSITVDYRDVGSDPNSAVAAYQEALSMGDVSMILGPLLADASNAVAAAANYDGERLPVLTFSKSDNLRTGRGVFRLGATAESQVSSLLEACKDRLGIRSFALVYPQNSNGYLFAEIFRQAIASFGLDLVYEASYQGDDQSALIGIAKELEQRGQQAVFLPDNLQTVANLLANISERSRRQMRFLGTAAWDDMNRLSHSGAILEGAVFVSPFFVDSPRAVIGQFVETYRSRHGRAPDFLAAQGFDAASLVINALRLKKDRSLTSLSEALISLDVYDGLTGLMYADGSGEVRRRYSVVELKSGKVIELPEKTAGQPVVPLHSWRGNQPQ